MYTSGTLCKTTSIWEDRLGTGWYLYVVGDDQKETSKFIQRLHSILNKPGRHLISNKKVRKLLLKYAGIKALLCIKPSHDFVLMASKAYAIILVDDLGQPTETVSRAIKQTNTLAKTNYAIVGQSVTADQIKKVLQDPKLPDALVVRWLSSLN